jgi:hypothetical protein
MKLAYAWTFSGELCAPTSAPPPGKRARALARLRACRALFRQAGERIFRAMLAVFRTGRRQRLAMPMPQRTTPRRPRLMAGDAPA